MTDAITVDDPQEIGDPPPHDSPDPEGGITPQRAPRQEMFASSATVFAFLAVFTAYSLWLGSDFLDVEGRMFDFTHAAPQLMMSIGVCVCLAAHQFDLAVASTATLSVFLTIGLYVKSGLPMGLAIAIALGVGATCGLVNGILVTKVRLSAFLATLGTGGIYAGLTVVYSSGQVIGPSPTTRALPSWFSGSGSIGNFQTKVPAVVGWLLVAMVIAAAVVSIDQRFGRPDKQRMQRSLLGTGAVLLLVLAGVTGVIAAIAWPVAFLLAVSMILWVFLKYTSTGRAAYAVGGNPKAAEFAGIRTDRITLSVFVISGTVSAFAGVMLASVQGSAVPHMADPLLIPTYAAVFLSTVLISRGRFHIWGTVVGGLFLVYVSSGLIEGGIKFTWTQVINGVVLVATVSLSSLLRKK